DDYLVKPVAPGLLLSTVATHVERYRFLRNLLNRDGLTNLLTHTAFMERAQSVIARARRSPERPAALVLLDLDNFTTVNDTYGHPVGDRVLVAVASLLNRRARQSDTVGRYGGEEFALLLEDLREEDVMKLLTRLREEFATVEHPAAQGQMFRVTFSAGVSM